MTPEFDPKLLLILIVLLGMIPSCICRNYKTCNRTTECGDREIRYPFWGEDRPESCGYPGFQLNCRDGNTLLLNMSSVAYRVHDIDYNDRRLLVSRDDLSSDLCRPSLLNTTLNSSIFNIPSIANYQNITLYYDCRLDKRPGMNPTSPYTFICGKQLNTFYKREVPGPKLNNINILSCDTNITVPVNQTVALRLENPETGEKGILEEAIDSGFWIQWYANKQGGLCGHELYSHSFACYESGNNSPNSPNLGMTIGNNSQASPNLRMIIGLSLGLPSIVVISLVAIFCIKKPRWLRKREQENQTICIQKQCRLLNQEQETQAIIKVLHHGSLAPKRYSYNQIKKMTKSFSEKLGRGAFGIVYKGVLPDDGQPVAVKVLIETDDNIAEDFINEVSSISKTSHVNIVNLLGFCYEGKKRALIYEFMPNKSLDNFISKSNRSRELEWEKMYEIALGIARGLEYLHRGCNTRIVHFDIKPQNILLDEDFCPKISDFGLAKLFQKKQSVISMLGARGTIGYIAPEVFSRSFGVVSHKSDVYSYGMMLLEMAGAKKAVEMGGSTSGENSFHDKIYKCVMLDKVMAEEKEESVRKMLLVGVWCIQIAAADRPSMTKVVEMLEGSIESIQIPLKPCWN